MKKQTHVFLEHNENMITNYTMIFYYRFVFFFVFISLIKGDGSSINFRHITVEKDGLSEATNLKNEILGYDAVFECIEQNIKKDPESLLKTMVNFGNEWMSGKSLDDDITILILEKK